MTEIPVVTNIPDDEKDVFDKFIKRKRALHIRTSQEIVDQIFVSRPDLQKYIVETHSVSNMIETLRTEVWEEFLKDELIFNTAVTESLYKTLDTPKMILDILIEQNIAGQSGEDLRDSVKDLCGEYAGRVFPYLYALSLSNTNSRRSRAGKSFEAIIYKIYDLLGYRFDSQNRLGRKIFNDVGLGKKVDSVLPGINEFNRRRNKTIIGTMKTSLRERWQEVAEEIERTKIPEIHLLTVDEDISVSKATEMGNHNIVIVAFSWVAESEKLKNAKNIVSFEEYFFEEIPGILEYWRKND